MMNALISVAVLAAYLYFLIRFACQSIIWFRASGQAAAYPVLPAKVPARVYISTMLDILFFRRIFAVSKRLWIGSWVFHISFFFVALRHMRFFFPSLPDCLIFFQPVGLIAGYLLPLSLLFLLILRTVQKKDRYASAYNYVVSGMLFLVSSIGLIMRIYFRPDLISVKHFILGIFGLSASVLPDSFLFLIHLVLFLLLLPYLPSHIIAAPFVNLEANRRMEGLRYVIHER